MLNETTDFINNAIGIDPAGCGCTDCIVGNSIPEDQEYTIDELIKAHFEESRDIINRTNVAMVLYKSYSGGYLHTDIPVTGSNPAIDVLPKDRSYYTADDAIVIRDSADPAEGEQYVLVDDEEAVQEAIEKHFTEGQELVNRTDETIIIYQGIGGDYGLLSIDAAGGYDPIVSVLPE